VVGKVVRRDRASPTCQKPHSTRRKKAAPLAKVNAAPLQTFPSATRSKTERPFCVCDTPPCKPKQERHASSYPRSIFCGSASEPPLSGALTCTYCCHPILPTDDAQRVSNRAFAHTQCAWEINDNFFAGLDAMNKNANAPRGETEGRSDFAGGQPA
jgi:hypothetical protein